VRNVRITLVLIILLGSTFFTGCMDNNGNENGIVEDGDENNNDVDNNVIIELSHMSSHFGFMHPEHFSEMNELGVYWQRPHPGPFIWNSIEKEQQNRNWKNVDDVVLESQGYHVNMLATIWPYADWDQKSCNLMLGYDRIKFFSELGDYRGKPCDLNSYMDFVETIVERYDGDGIDDMDGLVVPIKYWEVLNEPSMQEDLCFFSGSAQDYVAILNATYTAVKKADPNATVLMGGMAGVYEEMKAFWDQVFSMQGDDYFDIANIHSIGTGSEDLLSSDFNTYLMEHNISKKFWITEAQLSGMDSKDQQDDSSSDWPSYIVKTFIQAFANGTDKIFYVGLEQAPGDSSSWLIKNDIKQDTFYAFQTMVDQIDYFDSVEMLTTHQYKFLIDNETVYVCWSDGQLTSKITGNVTVTDLMGNDEELNANDIVLTDEPIFIRL